ncbi:TPA: baseplate assembly protein [Escherichia coli]|uniref:baseplate assembly protein n=1 Tax=Escherichia coli TaxID=562 RepID=UPI000B7EB8A2|nr:baseplate J/gp47 family protein [Escherichia coli]EKK4597815.1 baseplate J/gp47 family protein [Escherichia coli]MBB7986692.1 baseplate J/gp47 family protein [Escherichia coli]HBI7867269.1 baseplate J/gp47 family protein [Escherichia coli]HDX6772791.1 baseplate J/gp47 family protein [Escherichia coli]
MATSQAIIDLSAIPVPDAVEMPDTAVLVTQIVAKYQELDTLFSALVESDPAYKWAEALAFRVALMRQQINDAVRAVLLASACGNDLDQVGANFQVQRLVITPADDSTIPPTPAVYEDDDAFRERIQLSWARLSTAGAKNAYHYFAQSADPDVLDVKAYGPETHSQEGRVFLYVLSRSGNGTASQPLLDKVAASVCDDETRPLTDFVSVRAAEIIPYGLDGELVMANARKALQSYTDSVHRIGLVASRSGMDGALHQTGVITVNLTSPASDIVPAMGQAPWCRKVTLNKVETTDE